MTIRRRLHVFTDGDEESFHRAVHFASRRLPGDSPASGPPLHPALTDYGPETLGAFIRFQVEDARAEGRLATSPSKDLKGKGRSPDQSPLANIDERTSLQTFSPRRTATVSPRSRIDHLHARHLHNDQLHRPATVSLAPGALRRLRNLPEQVPAASGGLPAQSPFHKDPKSSGRKARRSPRKKSTPARSDNADNDDDPFIDQDPRPQPNNNSNNHNTNVALFRRSTTNYAQPSHMRVSRLHLFPELDVDSLTNDRDDNSNPEVPKDEDVDSTASDAANSDTLVYVDPNPGRIEEFDYDQVIPTEMPDVELLVASDPSSRWLTKPRRNARSVWPRRELGFRQRRLAAGAAPDGYPSDGDDDSDSEDDERPDIDYVDPDQFTISNNPLERIFRGRGPPISPDAPPDCPLPARADYQIPSIPSDVWISVSEYLSLPDIHSLRLVNRSMATEISPVQFRNFVAPLGSDMQLMCAHPSDSILAKHGSHVYRFGIAFEYDPAALAFAKSKNSMQTQQAWYGSFEWPASQYTRFEKIQELEDLVDNNNPMLKEVFSHLRSVWELGLSVDSGHGWLEGPDISDMALFDRRQKKGSKFFGQTFENEHKWRAHGRDEYFKWAQQNSINEALTELASRGSTAESSRLIETISRMQVRERISFEKVDSQPDHDPHSHTGGQALASVAGHAAPQPPPPPPPAPAGQQPGGVTNPGQAQAGPAATSAAVGGAQVLHQQALTQHQHFSAYLNTLQNAPVPTGPGNATVLQRQYRTYPRTPKWRQRVSRKAGKLPLQWPIIFNGYNLAAETGAMLGAVRPHVADPRDFPLLPGSLTEAQAQWLMETYWAQRSFISAYTNAVIANRMGLRQIRVLNIAKISSGLLPSLGQHEFWAALPNLKRLRLLVSPDWRKEHFHQSVFIQKALLISPLSAVGKFAAFLRDYICKLENLSHATFGWVGGGEHAVGICARNQNLLPAPIIAQANEWITDHDPNHQPDHRSMIKFDHIRDLTFENCWFSPFMMEAFMHKSQDTSLHTITLDSVSMLARHHTGAGELGLTTIGSGLQCQHPEEDWLNEEIPASATWTQTLDKITPGSTMLERKYNAGLIDPQETPMPASDFRGHVQKIVLKSCGYAKIEGMKSNQFNQSQLVVHPGSLADAGLGWRMTALRGSVYVDTSLTNERPTTVLLRYGVVEAHIKGERSFNVGPLMLSIGDDSSREEWHGLGHLTQCVHPVEKRVLEQAWGMTFGWGDTLERWAAVEDGKLEGGTGRFSGVIFARGAEENLL